MTFNAPGQHHADRYCAVRDFRVPLRFPDGRETGHAISAFQLEYADGRHGGRARLDHHEFIDATALTKINGNHQRLVFHRGGAGYTDPYAVNYGHVLVNDLSESAGRAVPSGGGRGRKAPTGLLYRLRVTQIPGDMFYKPGHPGSMWRTYGDLGARFYPDGEGDAHYAPLLWSFLNVPGGGMVRAVLGEDTPIRLCDVPKIKGRSWTLDGKRNGVVWGAYVKAHGLYGWIAWAHRLDGGEFTPHVVRA